MATASEALAQVTPTAPAAINRKRHRRGLTGFDVRSPAHAGLGAALGHQRGVVFERIQVDQQRWRIQLGDRGHTIPQTDRRTEHQVARRLANESEIMPFDQINGLRLFYHEQGDLDAPTIVFVHGTQGNASLYANLIDDLSDRFHCLALNNRGRPPSESPDDAEYSIEQFADDQAAFITAHDLREITIMGWSLGVRTVLAYLHRHGSERVAQAVLVGGPPSPNFGGQPLTDPDHDAPGRVVWGESFRAVTRACWRGSQHSRATCDLESTLKEIDVPVAIFHGRHDPNRAACGGRIHGG